MITLLVAVAGGCGAVLRLLADALVARHLPARVPLGTVVINVTGSFLLGLLLGAATGHPAWDDARTILGTGLIGGYTTFSTASVEAVTLAAGRDRRSVLVATGHAVVMIVLALAAASAGWWLTAR
ncbi:MAG TPA: CrcB family protein [Cellulomonas sp.]